MDLSASPAMTVVAPEQSDPIRLRSLGGDGTAEVEALIGDKLLDIMLYWRLLKRYDAKSEGRLTMLRGTMVSNETLALIGHPFVVPRYLSQHEWEGASIHEKVCSGVVGVADPALSRSLCTPLGIRQCPMSGPPIQT